MSLTYYFKKWVLSAKTVTLIHILDFFGVIFPKITLILGLKLFFFVTGDWRASRCDALVSPVYTPPGGASGGGAGAAPGAGGGHTPGQCVTAHRKSTVNDVCIPITCRVTRTGGRYGGMHGSALTFESPGTPRPSMRPIPSLVTCRRTAGTRQRDGVAVQKVTTVACTQLGPGPSSVHVSRVAEHSQHDGLELVVGRLDLSIHHGVLEAARAQRELDLVCCAGEAPLDLGGVLRAARLQAAAQRAERRRGDPDAKRI